MPDIVWGAGEPHEMGLFLKEFRLYWMMTRA